MFSHSCHVPCGIKEKCNASLQMEALTDVQPVVLQVSPNSPCNCASFALERGLVMAVFPSSPAFCDSGEGFEDGSAAHMRQLVLCLGSV